jgi:hypothetical protein
LNLKKRNHLELFTISILKDDTCLRLNTKTIIELVFLLTEKNYFYPNPEDAKKIFYCEGKQAIIPANANLPGPASMPGDSNVVLSARLK